MAGYNFTESDFAPPPTKSKYEFTEEDFAAPIKKKNADIDAAMESFRQMHPELAPVQGPEYDISSSLEPATPKPPEPAFHAPGAIAQAPERVPPITAMARQLERGEPVTEQPGDVLEEPQGEYRRLHPQTPLEMLQMPTKMPVPKMSEETGTKIVGWIDKLRARPSDPEQLKTAGKFIAGGEQALAGLVDFMTSPAGMATVMTGGAMAPEAAGVRMAALTQRGISTAFALEMAKNMPEQTATILDAINRGDTTTATREILNAGVGLAVMGHAAKGAVTPLPKAMPVPEVFRRPGERPAVTDVGDVIKNWFENKRLANDKIVDVGGVAIPVERPMLTPGEVVAKAVETEPLQPAAPAAQPKEVNASRVNEAEKLHENVPVQPVQGAGQVPAEKGGEGVQPHGGGKEGQAVREVSLEPHEQIAKELGIAARKPITSAVGRLWQFDITDPSDGQPAGFSIKSDSTLDEVRAKANEVSKQFIDALGPNPTPEQVSRMTPDQFNIFAGKDATGKGYDVAKQLGTEVGHAPLKQGEKRAVEELTALMQKLREAKTPEEQARIFEAVQFANGKKQYFSEGLRMLDAMKAVEDGIAVADAAKTHGVAEERLQANAGKPAAKALPEPAKAEEQPAKSEIGPAEAIKTALLDPELNEMIRKLGLGESNALILRDVLNLESHLGGPAVDIIDYLRQIHPEVLEGTKAGELKPEPKAPVTPTSSAAVPAHVKARMEGERQAAMQFKWEKLMKAPKEGRQALVDALTSEEAKEFLDRGNAGPPGTFDPDLKLALQKRWYGPGWVETVEQPKPAAPQRQKTVPIDEPALREQGAEEIGDYEEEFQRTWSKFDPKFLADAVRDAVGDPEFQKLYKDVTGIQLKGHSANWPNAQKGMLNVIRAVTNPAATSIMVPKNKTIPLQPKSLEERKLASYVRSAHPEIFHQLLLERAEEAYRNDPHYKDNTKENLERMGLMEAFALDKLRGLGLTDFGAFGLDDWADYREHVWTQKPGLAKWIETFLLPHLFPGKDWLSEPIAEEPEEASMADIGLESHGAPHGLPAGVPDRGPTFPAELMEASSQLGALVRSRATLRPGVQGQFVRVLSGIMQKDRIEVGDIRNQRTVAHEIGHSLDGILWPANNFGESQRSLAERLSQTYPTTSPQALAKLGKELHQELVPVSELMRGPMTGPPGHILYRKRATELIADYFSLYAHDRNRAATMAPKFTKGFEASLARDYNTQQVVQGIVAGNVIPKPPSQNLPTALAGMTGVPAQPGTPMPGAVPAPPNLPPPVRERDAAVAAEDLVKDAVRTLAAQVEKARIIADKWRRDLPNQKDRNDVGAFTEGIGNLELPGDTIDRVRNRMTPAKERFFKDYQFHQELARQEINKYLKETEEGEYLSFLEDYLGHFYVNDKAQISSAVKRFSKESPHAKQRKLPTLKEAVALGLKPITQDPANTYELTSRINWQVATNRKFVGKLREITTATGEPVVVPAGERPPGWEVTNNPLIQRVYARQTPGGLMLWKGGAAIHPDIWRAARQILDHPVSGPLGQAYDAINGFTRANAFAFSLFHDITLRSAVIGSQAQLTNPLRGLFRVMERNPVTGELEMFRSTRALGKELMQNELAAMDAAMHGLKFSYTDSEAYQHNARTFLDRRAAAWRTIPYVGKSTRLARDIQQWRQEGLWKNTHDAFKIIAYHDLVSKALQGAPAGTNVKAVKEQIASYLNDAFGGQEWQTKFWLDPRTRKVLSRFFLAPDWTLSTIRSVPLLSDIAAGAREQAPRLAGRAPFPTKKEGAGNARRLRFWGAELAALAMATIAAQYAITKAFGDKKKGDRDFPWENELNQKMRIDVTPIYRKLPWADPKDPTRHYVNLGKRPAEILNWFTDFDKQILSKSSRPVAIIFEQISGTSGDFKAPWKQDHEAFIESLPKRAVAIGKQALPFTLMGNQLALSVPVRKGMTKYKAQEAYESVFELVADPNRLRSLLRGQAPSTGTIAHMTEQITDAANRNGVPADAVMRRALSVVRGHHYNEFFKAFEAGDQKKMDAEARALIMLGTRKKEIKESLEKRILLTPALPPETAPSPD